MVYRRWSCWCSMEPTSIIHPCSTGKQSPSPSPSLQHFTIITSITQNHRPFVTFSSSLSSSLASAHYCHSSPSPHHHRHLSPSSPSPPSWPSSFSSLLLCCVDGLEQYCGRDAKSDAVDDGGFQCSSLCPRQHRLSKSIITTKIILVEKAIWYTWKWWWLGCD